MVISRGFRWLSVATLVAESHSTSKAACRQALAFGLGVSGSVDTKENQLQLKGLTTALTSPDVTSSILIPWTDISNMEVLQNLSTELRRRQRHRAPLITSLGKAIQAGARI